MYVFALFILLPKDSLEVAKRVKEQHSYVCPDLAKEFQKFDQKPEKYFKTYDGVKVRAFSC
jgi:actin-related protein 3